MENDQNTCDLEEEIALTDTASAQVRYTFTLQFIESAASFVRKAGAIEDGYVGGISDQQWADHRGFVSTAIMQCAAALETEAHEICTYGPGSHLGSGHTDEEAKKFLNPLADVVDAQETLSRYRLILHVLKKQGLEPGHDPYQSAALVVRLRNEITHYKSHWDDKMARSSLLRSLEALRHKPPPFTVSGHTFFPHRCLSAQCGAWAVKSTIAFLDKVYEQLGVPSRFNGVRERLVVVR